MFEQLLIGLVVVLLLFPFLKKNFTLTLLVSLVVLLAFFGDQIKEKFVVQGHGVPLNVVESKPLEEESMFLYKDSKCNAECCKGRYTYTCDKGCVCQDDKLELLATRGGNTTNT